MEEKNNTVKDFFWNLTGFKKDIIEQCKVDSYHVTIIGVLLLIVGVYATLAWTFFFQTVTTNPLIPIIAGLCMGLYILSFDRALIASMSTGNLNIFSVGFRLLLAGLLGIFLAQPMILKFYQGDITREAQIIVDRKNQERKKELKAIYDFDLKVLNDQKRELQYELSDKKASLSQIESDFIKEVDGTGGSGRIGYSEISKQKEKILNKHQDEYNNLVISLTPEINKVQKQIDEVNGKITTEFDVFKSNNKTFGMLVQVEALESLLFKDKTGSLRMRYYLLAFILALIELSALIAKMLFKIKSYKSKVSFITEEEVKSSENDKAISLGKLNVYKNLALESELEMFEKFFNETKSINHSKLDDKIKDWVNNTDITYKEFYELFKRNFIIHD